MGDTSQRPDRQVWADVVRGLAIGLMVFGHVIGGLAAGPFASPDEAERLKAVYRFVYAFHMPAFLWVSGVFAPASLRRAGRVAFLTDKLRTLAYPYLLWGLINWSCHAVMQRYTNSPFDPWLPVAMLTNPVKGLWFLYVLFLLMAGLAAIGSSVAGRIVFTAAAVGGYVASARGWTSDWPAAAALVAYHALWFAVGLWSARPAATAARLRWPVVVPVAVTGFAVVLAIYPPLSDTTPGGVAATVAGVIGLFAVSVAVADTAASRWAAVAGRRSLEIYVAHSITSVLARVLLTKVVGITAVPVLVVGCTSAGILGPLALAWAAGRLSFPWLFRVPRPVADRTRS